MPGYENGQNQLLITEFDLKTTNGSTQMIKALIPFFSPPEQQMLAMFVRIQELIMTVRYFEKLRYIQQQNNIKFSFNKDLFDHIKRYCTPENQKMIDSILQFMNISELMKVMNMFDPEQSDGGGMGNFQDIMNMFQTMNKTSEEINNTNPSSSGSPIDLMTSMMSDEQEALYNSFLDRLNEELI
ncbi:MAG: hypothetical protein NC086_10825 [Alistipes sp.]|nr:hypothetical protein [Alistipes sp.]